MRYLRGLLAVAAVASLAACGTNPKERTTGGAAAGAATGATVGALAGPPGMAVGALVGAGAGAATGATTSPNDVNLGKPPWTNPNTRVPTPNGPVGPQTSRDPDQSAAVNRLNDQSLNSAQSGKAYQP